MARLIAAVARLFGRDRARTSPVDSLGVAIAAASETGSVMVVPGIAAWLGCGEHTETDFHASIDTKLMESYEDFCARIDKANA